MIHGPLFDLIPKSRKEGERDESRVEMGVVVVGQRNVSNQGLMRMVEHHIRASTYLSIQVRWWKRKVHAIVYTQEGEKDDDDRRSVYKGKKAHSTGFVYVSETFPSLFSVLFGLMPYMCAMV